MDDTTMDITDEKKEQTPSQNSDETTKTDEVKDDTKDNSAENDDEICHLHRLNNNFILPMVSYR